jgi:hypothetical protein
VSCSSGTCDLRCAGDSSSHSIPNGGNCP